MSQILKPKKGYKLVKWLFGKEIEIPEEWKLVKLQKLVDKIGDGIHSTPKYVDDSEYYFINGNNLVNGKIIYSESTKNVTKEEYLKYKLELNDKTILLSINGTIGNVAFYDNELIVLGKSASYIICNGDLNHVFLFYLLQSTFTKKYFTTELTGTTIFNLSLLSIRQMPIILPDYAEQQKIATMLSNIDNLINSTHKLINQTISLKQGLMQKLSTKGIGHKKFKKVKWLFGKEIEIPEEWEIKKIDKIFEFLTTATNPRSDLGDSGDIQYIHYGDIHTKWKTILDCSSEEITWIDKDKIEKISLLKDGDLIIADASEDYEGSGTSVLLKNVENRKIVSGLHTIVLRDNDETISLDFKAYLMSIKFVKSQIIAYVTGISVYGLSKKNLKKIKIPLPPLSEQQKIATILSNIDSQIQSQTQYKAKLEKLKKSLMQKLLTGEVRVTV